MSKKAKKFLRILIILVLIGIIGFMLVSHFFGNGKHKRVEVVDEIKVYGYKLDENETKLYKDLFINLKDELAKEKPNEENYAKLVSELFVVDFYNLDNKVSKNDVGGLQFLQPSMIENFSLKASDSMYHSVEADLDGKRKQNLPEITAIEVTDVLQDKFSAAGKEDPQAYKVTMKMTYKENLGYESKIAVVLVHNDKRLDIVSVDKVTD